MNLAIKTQNIANLLFKIVMILVIIKAFWLGIAFYFQQDGIDKIAVETKSFYDKYRLSKAFGVVASAQTAQAQPQAALYKLDNIELQGTFVSKDLSFVTIKDDKEILIVAKQEQYKGFLLEEVKPKEAIFSKEGKKYKISLAEDEEISPPAQNQIMGDDVVRFVPKKEVKKYTSDIKNIWKNISIKEIVEKGKLKGFLVTRIEPNSVFAKLGLAKDDVIIGANNKIFATYSEVFDFYNKMDKIDSLKIIFKRNNEQKELEYEIY